MNFSRNLSLAVVLCVTASPVFAYGLDDVTKAASAVAGGNSASSASALANPQSLQLVQALNSLNVTPQQAVGGTAAMLDLAKNQLPGSQYSELTSSVPGLDQLAGSNGLEQLSGLTGMLGGSAAKPVSSEAAAAVSNVNSTQDLTKAFSALGMDGGMVEKFTPLLLDFLGGQGAGVEQLSGLGDLWSGA